MLILTRLLFPTQSRQEDELGSLTAAACPARPVISSSLSVFVQHILTVQHGVTGTAFMTAVKSQDKAEDVAVLELSSEENGCKIKLLQYKDCYRIGMNVLYSILICQSTFFHPEVNFVQIFVLFTS